MNNIFNLEETVLLSYIINISQINVKNIQNVDDIFIIEHNNKSDIFDKYSEDNLIYGKNLKLKFLENNNNTLKIKINKL